jgi:NADPH-dependent 2,4-dienoyl-CoA reductase/sulfur reductase-like enzyme
MSVERVPPSALGAGPAGLSAAIEAARAGADVLVIDENRQIGGQIFRQLPAGFSVIDSARLGDEYHRGRALFAELEGLPIKFLLGATVWGCFGDRVLEIVAGRETRQIQADMLVLATGAYDRPVPLPGWTLPGVLTVGGAQTILKSQHIIPGRRILMAGTGPLQLVVASQLAKAGAEIAAVVEAVRTTDVLRHAAALARAWSITRDGISYRWNVWRSRVRWIAPAILVRIDGTDQVERATVARVDADWRPIPGTEETFDVDTVCVGYGLIPSVELLRLCGCALDYDPRADVWIPRRTDSFETTVANVFAVGDGAGVAGAAVAADEGRVAGLAAAHRLGRLSLQDVDARMAPPRRRLANLARFREAMDDVYRLRAGIHDLATDDTIVCRCEEVRTRDIRAAVDDGATVLNQVKAWTRTGMGPCQARMCALPTAHIVARRIGRAVTEVGEYTPRPPAKPVSADALIRAVAGSTEAAR